MPNENPPLNRLSMLTHTYPTHEHRFALMGEALLFRTNDPRLLAAAHEAFGRFPPVQPTTNQPLEIHLFVHDPDRPTGRTSITDFRRPTYHTQGHLFLISLDADNLAIVDMERGFAVGYLSPEVITNIPFVRYIFIESMGLSTLDLARRYVPVHAACVVRNGRSVMLQGRAGTGKSTLAYACVRRGYKILAEDAVHVKIRPEGLELWGAPWRFHLLPDSKRFFPELTDYDALLQLNGEWKLEIDLEVLYPGSTVTRADPGPVVLMGQKPGTGESPATPSPTRIQAISPDCARREFEVLWPWQIGWTDEREAAMLSLLDYGVYRISVGSDPDEAADALDRLLDSF